MAFAPLPRMLSVLAVLGLMAASSCAPQAATRRQIDTGWTVYSNSKYGYEISYPQGYDLWETGLEGERDGASIRIGLTEYQALTPMLDVEIEPRMGTDEFARVPADLKDLRLQVEDIQLGGAAAKQAEYHWVQDGDLAFVEINLEGVLFRFAAGPGMRELRNTPWWEIISTFRFTKK